MDFETRREKKIRESLDMLFKGMDDDVLKTVIFYTATGKSEEEKEYAIEQLKRMREEEEARFRAFEITDVSEVVQEGRMVSPAIDVDLSQDNIAEDESDDRVWQLGKRHKSIASEHADDREHSIERVEEIEGSI